MIRGVLKLAVVMTLAFIAGTRIMAAIADWHQNGIDKAYNAGRDMERICANNDVPETCEKHNSDVDHFIFSGE